MRTVLIAGGKVDIWETPLGWRFAPKGHDDPESFSEYYQTDSAAEEAALLWAEDEAEAVDE